jgi:uncharacterized protein (DUF2141 family)
MRLASLVHLLVLMGTGPLAAQASDTRLGEIEVVIRGVRASQAGTLVVALYERRPGWLVLDSARVVRRVPAAADSLTVRFDSLPCADGYAVVVIHDRNGNDKLDMRWLPYPKPKEGSGVSNNHVRNGPPEYDPARLTLADSVATTVITMRY